MCKSLYPSVLWRTMDFLQILLLALYITQVFTKSRSRKHKESSSDEGSIENLLYYKDCQRNSKPEIKHEEMPLRYMEPPPPSPPPSRQPECAFPKMCCAMTCGNECGGSQPATSHMENKPSDNMQRLQSMQPPANPNLSGMGGVQPHLQRRKKKLRFTQNHMENFMQPPLPTRRDFSRFTKEKIKGLIAQDDDIRKILKDLVRVTMQKVDLLDMIKVNQNKGYGDVNTVRSVTSMVYDMDDYEE